MSGQPPGNSQQPQQQQPFLPPWYRAGSTQQQQQGATQAPPPYPGSSWGGNSNGSSGASSSSTGYGGAAQNSWRTNSPNAYQRPNTSGRGSGGSWGSLNGGGPGCAGSGRGYGGAGGPGRGRGSLSPQRAPSPPVWVKQDCWLLPKPGSVDAAAHAAAVARLRQQHKQQQQAQQQRGDSITVAAAGVAASAHAVAATAAAAAAAASGEGNVIDLAGSDDDAAAGGDSSRAAASAPAAAASPSKAAVIDLTGQTVCSPTTAVSQKLSGLELLLQQHRQQPQQQQAQQQQQQQQQAVPAAVPAAPPPRVVYIMRGLPGSGKSTRAAQLAAEATAAASGSRAEAVATHSTDSYFCDPVTGVYAFNFELLSVNHQKNFDAFCASLASGVGTVIVDNTNLQLWQYEKYVQQAWAAGYKVREEVVGEFTPAAVQLYAQRNVHGVPLDKLQLMLEQWQRQ